MVRDKSADYSANSNADLGRPDCLIMLLERAKPQFTVWGHGYSPCPVCGSELHHDVATALPDSLEAVKRQDGTDRLAR